MPGDKADPTLKPSDQRPERYNVPLYQIPAPQQFSFHAEEWEQWRLRFLRFRSASGLDLKNGIDQVNSLIYLMGPQAEPIFQSLKIAKDKLNDFEEVIKKFNDHFIPSKNVIYERYCFHTRIQQEGESVEDFVTALHTRSQNCGFPADFVNEAIRDQVVVGIKDKALSEKLQLDASLTLDKAVTAARQSEAVKKQQETFRAVVSADRVVKFNRTKPGSEQIHKFSQKSKEVIKCKWCGHPKNHLKGQ